MLADSSLFTKTKDGHIHFVLSDVSSTCFSVMIEYIYTNGCNLNSKIAHDLLNMATEYGLGGLKELCSRFLVQNVNENTACEILTLAIIQEQESLKKDVLRYIEKNSTV